MPTVNHSILRSLPGKTLDFPASSKWHTRSPGHCLYPGFNMAVYSCRTDERFNHFLTDNGADISYEDTNTASFQSLDEGDIVVVMTSKGAKRTVPGVPYVVQKKIYCCGRVQRYSPTRKILITVELAICEGEEEDSLSELHGWLFIFERCKIGPRRRIPRWVSPWHCSYSWCLQHKRICRYFWQSSKYYR